MTGLKGFANFSSPMRVAGGAGAVEVSFSRLPGWRMAAVGGVVRREACSSLIFAENHICLTKFEQMGGSFR